MGMLEEVQKHSPSKGASYLEAGDHIAVIQAVKLITTQVNGEAVVVELRVFKSSNSEIPKNSVRTVMYMRKFVAAMASFRSFVMEVADVSEEESGDPAVLHELVGDSKPMEGVVVQIKSTLGKTKGGNDFTRHEFSACEDAALCAQAKE